ncbi:MAG: YceI family protein [Solirubrobacterales bacterium]
MKRWSFEPGHTAAVFTARHMMITKVTGAFKDVHGRVDFDLADCMQARFEGVIDATRLWTGEPTRDAHLRSADFFDVENHPQITFDGRFTERVGHTEFKATADLEIRGKTNEVPLDVSYLGQWTTPYWEGDENKGEMTRIGFELSSRVNRHEWGVSWNDELPGGGVVASNWIDIAIDVEAILDDDLRAVGLGDALYAE